MNSLNNLIKKAKSKFDLTEVNDQDDLFQLTNALLASSNNSISELKEIARKPETPLEFKIAVNLVKSKRFLNSTDTKLKLGVVFAMWGEHNRLLPKSADNPNGEDTLRTKLEQMRWATENSNVEWTLYAVDDGCPYGSGKMAKEIAQSHPLGSQVKVLFLEKAVPTTNGPLKNLQSADDSKKGGAIILGCQQAIADSMDAIIYTDADNSVHLGQIGLLLEQHIDHGFKVVLGDRKDPDAVLVKQENRWGIGIKLLRHMQRMVGRSIFSQGILDSQAAFKLYSADLLERIIEDPAVYDFSFDSDWIAAVINQEESFAKVPFAFIDSFAESASIVQGPMTTWETLLMGLVKAVKHRNLPHNEKMATVLEEEIKSSADLDLLINHLPPELENAGDKDLGNSDIMAPEAVQEWIRHLKNES
jgi:glycosyltransferase involved in cell wall biosynthesis